MEWWAGILVVVGVIGATLIVGGVGFVIAALCGAFEETGGSQLQRLRQEYRKLLHRYESRYDDYDCGVTLAEYIDVTLSEWGRRMREIEVEVETIIREEQARGNAVPFEI